MEAVTLRVVKRRKMRGADVEDTSTRTETQNSDTVMTSFYFKTDYEAVVSIYYLLGQTKLNLQT